MPGSGDQTGLAKVLGNSANEVARHIKSSAKSAFDSAIGNALTKIGARDAEPTDRDAKTDDSETTDKDGTLRFLSFIQDTNLDAHAPVYYAVHIWNALTEEIG